MNGKTRSILLQVAFKAAANMGDVTTTRVQELFDVLIELHDNNNINPDEGSGTTRRSSGTRSATPSAPKPSGNVFLYGNVLVEDFRTAKADPTLGLKPNYPDFKTVNGDTIDGVTTDRGAAWLYDQQGNPNEAVAQLVKAADTAEF